MRTVHLFDLKWKKIHEIEYFAPEFRSSINWAPPNATRRHSQFHDIMAMFSEPHIYSIVGTESFLIR